jgi:hydroxymethylbilane synthase
MSLKSIRIGARGSRLSLRQTEIVADLLRNAHPGIEIEIRTIATAGDRNLETPLPQMGGKGVFTDEIEQLLLDGEIDFAVHSLKDLPVELREGIAIGAIPARGSVDDVLVTRDGATLSTLAPGACVGTSSLRREAQILAARPDLRCASIRGNVETRVGKLLADSGSYVAIVLARAGIERLGLDLASYESLSLEVMLPAPGQGALAVQCRPGSESAALLEALDHRATRLCTVAERSFLSGVGGGCSTPVAALGRFAGAELSLRGRVIAVDGSAVIEVVARKSIASEADADAVGRQLAQEALDRGATGLLGVHE